jgi:hypothetical protein
MITALRRARIALTLVALLAPPAAPAADTPADAVNAFLSFYFKDYQLGLPERALLGRMKPFLTPRLYSLFEAAAKAQECRFAKVGNSEPPLFEGDLFSSLTEGAKAGTATPAVITDEGAVVTISWTYDDPDDQWPATNWTDRIFLEQSKGDWRIADFAHDGHWDFMSKEKVSSTLKAIAMECLEHPAP